MIPLATADRAHAGDRIGRPITPWDIAIARTLLREVHHINVAVDVQGDVVHLTPHRPVTTGEEVLVLRQFLAFTDSPLRFHQPPADIIWTSAQVRS